MSDQSPKVKRWSLHRFAMTHIELLPTLSVGYEPGAFGYPAASWVGCGWLRWHWQFTLHHGNRIPLQEGEL